VARMASGRRGDAVGTSGKRVRKSATSSMSKWPIARNSSGGMSAGAERLRERSVVFAAFALAAFLAGAIFDFGKF